MKLEIKIVAPIIFTASAIPLMDPFLGFAIMKGIAYQVHIIAYFLGIIVGSVLQVLLFEDFGIYSKIRIFLNRGVMENEENIKEKQSVIRELMKEAIRENADWMLMHTGLEERIPL